MKAAVLLAPEKLEIQTLPDPVLDPGEILVKLKACGICTLEQRLYTGAMKISYPLVPGHEAAGEIVEVGKKVVGNFAPGMRVALDLVMRCGQCYYCRIGRSNHCANRFKPGQRILGGFAEYIAVRPGQVYPAGANLSFLEAAFTEPLSCCIHSLKRLKVAMSEDVLIVGAGVMGMLHILVARNMGLRVTVSEPDEKRLAVARELGADFAINPRSTDLAAHAKDITEGLGFSACIVTSPAPAAFEGAVAALAKCARINIYTAYEEKMVVPLDANTIHRQEFLVTGTEGRLEEDFFQAIRLLSFGKVKVASLISARTSFPALVDGMKKAISKETFRVLLEHEAG
jgi:2-desacetyl-2-hydroxyethyl bacteriochlorophyllide A dehydrogenase